VKATPVTRLPPAAKDKLKSLAERDGRTEGDIIADALKLYEHVYKVPRDPVPSKAGRPKK
jgi:predicted DNA-binding protein